MLKLSLEKLKEDLIKRYLIDSLGVIQGNKNRIENINFINLDNDSVSEIEIEEIQEYYNNKIFNRYIISFQNDKRYILPSKDEYVQFLTDNNLNYEGFTF